MSVKHMTEDELEKYTLPMTMKKIIQRSCKGPISISRVCPKGDFILLENTCVNKPIVLTNWILKRRGVDVPVNSFTFEKHFVLRPGRIVKIYAKGKGRNNPPHELASDTVSTWGCGTYALTQLVNHLNQEKATLLEKYEHYEREVQQKPGASRAGSVMSEINSNKIQINRLLASSPLRNSLDRTKLLNNSPTKRTPRASESPVKRHSESPRIITPTIHKKQLEAKKNNDLIDDLASVSNYEINFQRNTS